ncbi:MAG TPA: SRPBCC family protein [Gemmatimonadales bacterium]|nr:SRPBCC family protein [Gemmatimonadales bacterium]
MTSMINETRAGNGRARAGEHPPDYRPRARERSGMMRPETLAKGLGWFSVGLGVAQIVAPRRVARLIGVRPSDRTAYAMRAMGARELASGIGILAQARPTPWLWARVGGDVMDLALLGRNLDARRNGRGRLVAATAAVAAVTALDLLASQQLSSEASAERLDEEGEGAKPSKGRAIHVVRSITIDRAPEEVYAFWRDFENLPRFMEHLESVQVTGERRSHWKAKAPAGRSVEWDAEMTEDVSGERIAWRSLPGADVPNRGVVRFLRAPADGGTEVHVDLRYEPPAGRAGAAIAKLFGEEPELQLASDLRRFKQVLETGEVVRSDASIHEKMHPAQPPVGDVAVGVDVEGGY